MSDKTLGSSRLEFNLKGENIDYVVVNTIRRIAMSNIPVYSFQDFKFNKNSTVFNNNIIKSRLKNMVVWGIKNDHKTLIGKDMSEKEEDIEGRWGVMVAEARSTSDPMAVGESQAKGRATLGQR